MARVGLSKPYVALYNYGEDGAASYSGGVQFDRAVNTSFSPDSSEDNILYGDNGPAESDKTFGGGTLTVGTTELPLDVAAVLFGLTVEEVTVGEATGRKIAFGGSASIPYVGYGVVVKKSVNNVPKFMAVVFRKVQFAYPGDDYETQGKTISWKTPSLTASVMRDDTAAQNWRDWVEFDTEAAAEAYIKQELGVGSAVTA